MTRIDKGMSSMFQDELKQAEELDKEIADLEQKKAIIEGDIASLRKVRLASQAKIDAIKLQSEQREAARIAAQFQHTGRMQ